MADRLRVNANWVIYSRFYFILFGSGFAGLCPSVKIYGSQLTRLNTHQIIDHDGSD
jgi:hypothetical protein